MTDRPKTSEAVFIVVIDRAKVLLQERKNTGWLDGWYDLPSGHVEPGEQLLLAAVRELKEETDIEVAAGDLELFHVSQSDAGSPYTYFMFRAKNWQGEPKVADSDRVSNVGFYDLDKLPAKTAPYVKRALDDLATTKVTFAYFGPGDHG